MEEPAADPALTSRLRELADGQPASVRFDRFMETVLYAPGPGYYARPESPTGRAGDFYTAPQVHPLFARTVARRTLAEFERLGRPPGFRLVDVGLGDGTLGAELIEALAPSIREGERIEYVGVDRTLPRRAAASTRIRDRARGSPVAVSFLESVAQLGPFEGAVVANELLDAFPCRRLIARAGAWRELGVSLDLVPWSFVERTSVEPIPGGALPPAGEDGLIFEIAPIAEAWVREIGDHLVRGSVLLLDYGDEQGALLGAHPYGTLTALRGHRVVDDVLAQPGRQDLSAFVNFTRIRQAAERSGLRATGLSRQSEALGRWGFATVLQEGLDAATSAEAEVRLRLAAKNLLFGFEQFRVLELEAGPVAT